MKNSIILISLLFISLCSCSQNNKAKEIGQKNSKIFLNRELNKLNQDFIEYAKYRLSEEDFVFVTKTDYIMFLPQYEAPQNSYKELFDIIEDDLKSDEVRGIKDLLIFKYELEQKVAKKESYQANIEKLIEKAKKANYAKDDSGLKEVFQTFEKEIDNTKTYGEIIEIHKSNQLKKMQDTPQKDIRTIVKDEINEALEKK